MGTNSILLIENGLNSGIFISLSMFLKNFKNKSFSFCSTDLYFSIFLILLFIEYKTKKYSFSSFSINKISWLLGIFLVSIFWILKLWLSKFASNTFINESVANPFISMLSQFKEKFPDNFLSLKYPSK